MLAGAHLRCTGSAPRSGAVIHNSLHRDAAAQLARSLQRRHSGPSRQVDPCHHAAVEISSGQFSRELVCVVPLTQGVKRYRVHRPDAHVRGGCGRGPSVRWQCCCLEEQELLPGAPGAVEPGACWDNATVGSSRFCCLMSDRGGSRRMAEPSGDRCRVAGAARRSSRGPGSVGCRIRGRGLPGTCRCVQRWRRARRGALR
jgi:hypothetical protein